MEDIEDGSYDNTKESEGHKAIENPTEYDRDAVQDIMDGDIDDDDTSQGLVSRYKPIPNEQETHDTNEDTNLWRSVRYIKTPSKYKPSFDGKQYGSQLFGV